MQGQVGKSLGFKSDGVVLLFKDSCVLKTKLRVGEAGGKRSPALAVVASSLLYQKALMVIYSSWVFLTALWLDAVWERLDWLRGYFCRNIVFHIPLCSPKDRLTKLEISWGLGAWLFMPL